MIFTKNKPKHFFLTIFAPLAIPLAVHKHLQCMERRYKNKESDRITWIENTDNIGEHLFTFDGKKIFNIFADYPHNLSAEEKAIFDKENPEWANFFAKEGE